MKKIIVSILIILIMLTLFFIKNYNVQEDNNEGKILSAMDKDQIEQNYNFKINNEEYSSIHDYKLEELFINKCTAEEYIKTLDIPKGMISSYKEDNFEIVSYSEGAAGSIYKTINYIFNKDNKCYALEIIERISSCGAYFYEKEEVDQCIEKQNKGLDNYNKKIKELLLLIVS